MRWNEEEEHLLRLLIPTNSYNEIAEEFSRRHTKGLPGHHTLRTVDAIRRKCSRDNINTESVKNYKDPFTDRWEYIKSLNKEYKLKAERNDTGIVAKPHRKILSLSDIHFPWALEDELEAAIEMHSDADIVVLNGDILDGYAFSTYGRAKRVGALKEYISAFELVKTLSERFPHVVIVSGNHDRRPAKTLSRNDFEKEATQILRPDLLARIANGEVLNEYGEIVEILDFDNVIYEQYDSWYVRLGQTIFCHPDAYQGGNPGATVIKLLNYFTKRLGSDKFDSIVVGHTHRIYKGIFFNKMLIEQGAMCARQPYQHKADLRFPHAMNGYAVVWQDENGNTDFNSSHVVYLGSELPPKKEVL